MFADIRRVHGGTACARQAFDESGIVQEDGFISDGFDHRPVVMEALQAQNNGSPGSPIQKGLHRDPESGQVWVGNTAPGDFHARNTLFSDYLVEDQQHLGMDDAADQHLAEQPAPRKEMNQIVEQLLCLLIGGTVDDPFGVDDAVESA